MSIIDSLRSFIQEKCPLLSEDGRINVNYLSNEAVEYSIEEVPSDPLIKRYTDGDELRRFIFYFASRENYNENILANIKNSEFYEQFSDWVDSLTELPVLGDKKQAQRLECTTGGYIAYNEIGNARYQIQMRLVYIKRK